jgi:ribonuclease III
MTLPYPRRQQQLENLAQRLAIPTIEIRWDLLDLALTHSTSSATANYEQLEFVGDAVVKLAAAEFLLETYPQFPVGEFTALRSVLVSDRILAQIADQYGFDRYLLASPSAIADRAGRESRLADSLEAVLAALYLSKGTLQLIRPWLDPHFQALATEILADPARQNYKAALQNWTQAHQKTLPEYRSQETGQAHNDPHRFVAAVWIQGKCWGEGTGRSIKAAEQVAAQVAFLALSQMHVTKQD